MKGHIVKRSTDSWSIVIELPRDPATGKRRQSWHTIKGTKKEADKKLRELLTAQDNGIFVKQSKLSFGEWLENWCRDYVKIQTTQRTFESYYQNIIGHIEPALGKVILTELTPQIIQAYYARQLEKGRADGKGGLSARSVLYQHRIISKCLKQATKLGLIMRNPADAVEPPRPRKTAISVPDKDELPRLLDAFETTPYYVFYCLLLYCGMRRGEALALRWKDIDLKQDTIQIAETAFTLRSGEYVIKEPKTPHSRRCIDIPPTMKLLLLEYKADQTAYYAKLGVELGLHDFVFTRPNGEPLNPNTVTHTFLKAVRKAGFDKLRLHDLRHLHATLMLQAGIHPKIVSERLGHASINITLDTYSHVMPGLQKKAVNVFDKMLSANEESLEENSVSKRLAKHEGVSGRPYRSRTCDPLIKSQMLYQLS